MSKKAAAVLEAPVEPAVAPSVQQALSATMTALAQKKRERLSAAANRVRQCVFKQARREYLTDDENTQLDLDLDALGLTRELFNSDVLVAQSHDDDEKFLATFESEEHRLTQALYDAAATVRAAREEVVRLEEKRVTAEHAQSNHAATWSEIRNRRAANPRIYGDIESILDQSLAVANPGANMPAPQPPYVSKAAPQRWAGRI